MLWLRRKRLVLDVLSEVERLAREDRQPAPPALHSASGDERLPRAPLSSVLRALVERALFLTPRDIPAGLVAESVVRDTRRE
jgi:hypothetical protein